jgi:hypothetical protein
VAELVFLGGREAGYGVGGNEGDDLLGLIRREAALREELENAASVMKVNGDQEIELLILAAHDTEEVGQIGAGKRRAITLLEILRRLADAGGGGARSDSDEQEEE